VSAGGAAQSGRLPSAGWAAEALSAERANEEAKAAGAVRRDIKEMTGADRAADRRADRSSAAVRAAARQAVSVRVERRAADGRAAAKAGDAKVVHRAAVRAGAAGSSWGGVMNISALRHAQGRNHE
jgi:hypothetical protein